MVFFLLTLVAHGRVQEVHVGRGEADAVDGVGHAGLGRGGQRRGRASSGRRVRHAGHPLRVCVAVVGGHVGHRRFCISVGRGGRYYLQLNDSDVKQASGRNASHKWCRQSITVWK